MGTWKGTGRGEYPTIQAFEYFEQLTFSPNPGRPAIHYEQQTWLKEPDGSAGRASHWETGFIHALGNGSYQISNSQGGARVEVLQSVAVSLDSEPKRLAFTHLLVGNDARIIQTARRFAVEGDRLEYTMQMETTQTRKLLQHVEAVLWRQSSGFRANAPRESTGRTV